MEQKTFREELIMQLTKPQRNRRIHRCLPVNNVLQENRIRTSFRGQVPVAAARTTGIHHHMTTKDGGILQTCRVCGYQRKAEYDLNIGEDDKIYDNESKIYVSCVEKCEKDQLRRQAARYLVCATHVPFVIKGQLILLNMFSAKHTKMKQK